MKNRSVLSVVGVLIVAGLIAASFLPMEQGDETVPTPAQTVSPMVDNAPERASNIPTEETLVVNAAVSSGATTAPFELTGENVFQIDAGGRLVVNEQTRIAIEKLALLNSAAELEAKKLELAQHLPPVAAAEVMQLFDRFQNFSTAARQMYPPGVAPASAEDAIAELEGLHALRVAHFGAEVAQAFYGDEEAINRQMVELLRLENDQSLTPEEKVVKAQQLRESLPGIAAIESKNREGDSAPR